MPKRRIRRICVCTGTRAEYGILRPVMRRIASTPGMSLQVVAAGMHLSRAFGYTAGDIARDGFAIDAKVEMLPRRDTSEAMAEGIGRGIIGFTRAFVRLDPDIVVVLGDRTEAFAAATAAAVSGRVVAHIHGGDRAEGGYDDVMRHAITKLSHLHFAATSESARRIERLGEPTDRIFVVGAPGLDEIDIEGLPAAAATRRRLGFDASTPMVLCVQHSVSTHGQTAAAEMEATLGALARLALPTVVVYPNSDAGGRAIIDVIEAYAARFGPAGGQGTRWMRTFKNLPRDEYLAVMKAAAVMVGNSSSGIIEAASFGLPVVNVGRRQAGRQRGGNTVDVPHGKAAILKALRAALYDRKVRRRLSSAKNVYGDGRASERIAEVLSTVELAPEIIRKQITY